jgi:hypothetical protein
MIESRDICWFVREICWANDERDAERKVFTIIFKAGETQRMD